MAHTIILHITNSEPLVGEVEQIPSPSDTLILLQNPRLKDGKEVPYLSENVESAIWPMHRVSFIEIITSTGEEEIIGFVR